MAYEYKTFLFEIRMLNKSTVSLMVPFGKDALDYPGFTIIYKASIPDDEGLNGVVAFTVNG